MTEELAAVLHAIVDGMGPQANHDELHDLIDAVPVQAPLKTRKAGPPPEADSPAPWFGTEDSPHAPV